MRTLLFACGMAASLLIARQASAGMDIKVSHFAGVWFDVELPDGTIESVEVTRTWRIMESERSDAAGGDHFYLRSEIRASGIGELTGIRYTFIDGFNAKYNLKFGVEAGFTELRRIISQGSNPNPWESAQLTRVTVTPKGKTVVDFTRER